MALYNHYVGNNEYLFQKMNIEFLDTIETDTTKLDVEEINVSTALYTNDIFGLLENEPINIEGIQIFNDKITCKTLKCDILEIVEFELDIKNLKVDNISEFTDNEGINFLNDVYINNNLFVDKITEYTAANGVEILDIKTNSLTGVDNLAIDIKNDINVLTGNTYKINEVDVLSANTLGTNIVNSSLKNLGILTSLTVDNIFIDGNTISTTNTNGNIILSPNGTGILDIKKNTTIDGTIDVSKRLTAEDCIFTKGNNSFSFTDITIATRITSANNSILRVEGTNGRVADYTDAKILLNRDCEILGSLLVDDITNNNIEISNSLKCKEYISDEGFLFASSDIGPDDNGNLIISSLNFGTNEPVFPLLPYCGFSIGFFQSNAPFSYQNTWAMVASVSNSLKFVNKDVVINSSVKQDKQSYDNNTYMELSQQGLLEVADNLIAENLISRSTLVIKDNYRIVELNLENFGSSTQKYIRLCPRLSNNCFRGTFFCSRTSSGNSTSMNGKICASFGQNLQFNCTFDFQRSKDLTNLLTCGVVRNNDFLFLLIDADTNHMPRFITFYAETNGFEIIGDTSPSGTIIIPSEIKDTTTTFFGNMTVDGSLFVDGNILTTGDVSSTSSNQVTKFRIGKPRDTSQYAIGEYVLATHTSRIDRNEQIQVRLSGNSEYIIGSGGTQLQGAWEARGSYEATRSNLTTRFAIMCQRIG